MKTIHTYSKILLIALAMVFSVTGLSAQTPDDVFKKVSTAILQKNAASLEGSLAQTVEVTHPSTDQAYSSKQALYVLDEFFKKYPASSFEVVHKGSSGSTNYASGTYKSGANTFDTNVFVKKIGEAFVITQIRFEQE